MPGCSATTSGTEHSRSRGRAYRRMFATNPPSAASDAPVPGTPAPRGAHHGPLGSDHGSHQRAAGVVDGGIGTAGHQLPNALRPGRIPIVHHSAPSASAKSRVRSDAVPITRIPLAIAAWVIRRTHGARYSLHENRCAAGRVGEVERQAPRSPGQAAARPPAPSRARPGPPPTRAGWDVELACVATHSRQTPGHACARQQSPSLRGAIGGLEHADEVVPGHEAGPRL